MCIRLGLWRAATAAGQHPAVQGHGYTRAPAPHGHCSATDAPLPDHWGNHQYLWRPVPCCPVILERAISSLSAFSNLIKNTQSDHKLYLIKPRITTSTSILKTSTKTNLNQNTFTGQSSQLIRVQPRDLPQLRDHNTDQRLPVTL